MTVQLVKQDDGSYKVSATIAVPKEVEEVFSTVEEAVNRFKELEAGKETATQDGTVEPGV